jgi:hypothetical protein
MSKSEIKYSKKKFLPLYEEIQQPLNFFIQSSNFFMEFLNPTSHIIIIYMHLLTWIGFGLIGYVPNTLYTGRPTDMPHVGKVLLIL